MTRKFLFSLATASILLTGASNALAQSQNASAPQTPAVSTADTQRPGGAAGPARNPGATSANMFTNTTQNYDSQAAAPKTAMADNR
jgi:hypothetical protein